METYSCFQSTWKFLLTELKPKSALPGDDEDIEDETFVLEANDGLNVDEAALNLKRGNQQHEENLNSDETGTEEESSERKRARRELPSGNDSDVLSNNSPEISQGTCVTFQHSLNSNLLTNNIQF